MSIRQPKRVLERIKAKLIEKYRDLPDGDVRVCNELQVYLKLYKSNVPLKYWMHEVKDLTDPGMRRTVEAYIEKLDEAVVSGIGIYFSGTQGTGKTLAACIILKEAIRRGYTVYFTMLNEVLEKYCDGRYNPEARAEFAKSILEADILVVDDIDKGYISDKSKFIDTAYDYVFRKRANDNLPVIITSNQTRRAFTEQEALSFGQSLFSLFEEHLWEVICGGVDRRRRTQEKMREFFNG